MKTNDEARRYSRRAVRRWVYGFWIFGWTLLAWACQPKEDKPDNLIPEDKMVEVLTDIHLAEARVTKLGIIATDSQNLVYRKLEKQIYARYQLDTGTYYRSYQYYSSNPEKFASLYKQVIAKLEEKKQEDQKKTK
ncbi:DUF4296 domain-containing protein [Tellurirhabdus rosea]|uniref:DUF4296 domain-containing protein n=1 Tax=Tellurirhabdus rosea TaxID=2674997 RepID=UPI002258A60B|nr:DUF4296 domain-containing protein [Tellurirhabdus rosea]